MAARWNRGEVQWQRAYVAGGTYRDAGFRGGGHAVATTLGVGAVVREMLGLLSVSGARFVTRQVNLQVVGDGCAVVLVAPWMEMWMT